MSASTERPKLLVAAHHYFDIWSVPEWFAGRLQKDFPQVNVVDSASDAETNRQISDADAVIAWRLTPEAARAAQKLRWLHSTSAAVNQLLYPEIVDGDVLLTNGSEVHGAAVAEHILALLLALAKKLPEAARFQQKHFWAQQELYREPPRPKEIAGAVLGLIGLGHIGSETARRALALGMRVIGLREHPERGGPEGVEKVFGPGDLQALLSESDFVVLTAPVTLKTRNLMTAERIGQMKPDARLINVGRGQLIDETALIQALRERRIAGAALDVFVEEPLPPDSPLWDIEHVLITPHVAINSEKQWERQYALVAENLRRYLSQRPLLSVVDKKRGY